MSASAHCRRALTLTRPARARLTAVPHSTSRTTQRRPCHCSPFLSPTSSRLVHSLHHSHPSRLFSTSPPASAFTSSTPSSSPTSPSSSPSSSSKRSAAPPTLNATLRRFYFLVHPDLFHSHPHHRSINEANLQHFLGFITAMKQTSSTDPWPPAQHTNLTFFIRRKARDGINTGLSFVQWNEAREGKGRGKGGGKGKVGGDGAGMGGSVDGDFHVLRLTLSTNGGNCKGLVERQLKHLFHMMALKEDFVWDDEYWQTKPRIDKREEDVMEDEEEAYV